MGEGALTAEAILAAAEEVLRRFGPAKTTVVDVARRLGVSHGSVYRHFPTKAALCEAVTRLWAERAYTDLARFAEGEEPAGERMHGWLAFLFAIKRQKALDDPEMFASYSVLAGKQKSTLIAEHIETLIDQLARIIEDGAASGEFSVDDTGKAARVVFDATARFHDPVHAHEWADPEIEAAFEAVCSLILAGLRAGTRR